jgi:hypothetical protein
MYHEDAAQYYRRLLSLSEDYEPVYASELIDHAIQCGIQNLAFEKGGEVLSFLRNYLARREALITGLRIEKSMLKRKKRWTLFKILL